MVFSSIKFLFVFLPIFLFAYCGTELPIFKRWVQSEKKLVVVKNAIILIGSLIFYSFGEGIYVWLMLGTISVNYVLALSMDRWDSIFAKRSALGIALLVDFGLLVYFKYFNFFAGMIESGMRMFDLHVPRVKCALPLGISFYTFQIVAYMIDIYREKYPVERNLLRFAVYISMFPQLIAGPIVNYGEVSKRLKMRKMKVSSFENGAVIFIAGLSYKVLLANKIGTLWNSVLTGGVLGMSTPMAWLGSVGFSMQIYFDFFGYSLMAMGLGKMLGFTFPVNFDCPYCATSMTEFFRKWHMTLGRWFREYVYIPLGGNRKGRIRTIINLLIVWLLTGLWHGANWNFLLWGIFCFCLIAIEKCDVSKSLNRYPLLGHLYMAISIPISWTIFNISDLKTLGQYLFIMFGGHLEQQIVHDGIKMLGMYVSQYGVIMAICFVCITPLPMRLLKKYYKTIPCKVIMLLLFWFSVVEIMQGSNNPFLYFRF